MAVRDVCCVECAPLRPTFRDAALCNYVRPRAATCVLPRMVRMFAKQLRDLLSTARLHLAVHNCSVHNC